MRGKGQGGWAPTVWVHCTQCGGTKGGGGSSGGEEGG